MKLLINTTNLIAGGGVQVALSFIRECFYISNNRYDILLTDILYNQLKGDYKFDHIRYHLISHSPASLKNRKKICKEMSKIEQQVRPDCIFTVFGPSYWKPRAPHICGFALPWIVSPENPIHARVSKINSLKLWFIKKYKWYHFNKEVDFLWCETNDVRKRINQIFSFPLGKVGVVGNTYGDHFAKFILNNKKEPLNNDHFTMVTISAYYPHKNLEIIKQVIPLLTENIQFKFVLTLPDNKFMGLFSQEERKYIHNLGPIPAIDCPKIYATSDALFLPTLLECFSANYPEAMIMEKPILTSNYSFATDVCKDAAEYFDPLNPQDIAEKIIRLASDKIRCAELIKNGKKRVKAFPTSKERAMQLIAICEKVIGESIFNN